MALPGDHAHQHAALELAAGVPVELINGEAEAEFLLLQGRPINESVAQYGPFVMNTREELMTAVEDFQAGRLV